MKNWESEFAPHILKRGFDYFDEGAVHELIQTSDGYEATVEGSHYYRVEIAISDQRLMAMSCDCPYAEDSKNCKHMAAVLYAIEKFSDDAYTLHDPTIANSSIPALEKLIQELSEDELRHFLCEYAVKDESMRNALVARYASLSQPRTLTLLKREVDQTIDRHGDRSGFIDYQKAWKFESDMIDILNDRVSPLIDRKECTQAFDLSAYVFTKTAHVDIDDSDGTVYNILGTCCDCWAHILSVCSVQEKERIYAWLESQLESSAGYAGEELISDFIMEHFDSHNFLLKKLKIVDEQIRYYESKPDEFSNFKASQLLLDKIRIMKDLKLPESEISAFTDRHYALPGIRQYLIDCAISENRIPDAISLLLESKMLDRDTGYTVRYSEQLIELYKAQNNNAAYLNELREYVLHTHQYSLEYIFKWKNAVSAGEWVIVREEILNSKYCEPIRLKLLEFEHLYERLLHAVLAANSSDALVEYEKTLRPLYPNELLSAWKTQITVLAQRASNRKNYYSVMQLLRKLPKYPGGQEAAEQFAKEWRIIYRRRPAMLDELMKAGF